MEQSKVDINTANSVIFQLESTPDFDQAYANNLIKDTTDPIILNTLEVIKPDFFSLDQQTYLI